MATSDHVVANRDQPLPVLQINGDETPSIDDPDSARSEKSRLRRTFSPSRLQEKLQDAAVSSGFQDRLFSVMFEQMLPSEHTTEPPPKQDARSKKTVTRPNFSLPVMSTNFRRFNARIGVVFVFQERAIRLFAWRVPSHTWSFLAVYSFCCLDPGLLVVLPLAVCLLFIMVPAFTTRHPPPPSSLATDPYEIHGPALAPPPIVKPAPETSKDFFRNMRDLQNCMEDFSVLHDQVLTKVGTQINFSNERVSSTIFLGLAVTSFALFVASSLIPWRLLFLSFGWIAIGSAHPSMIKLIESIDKAPIKLQIKRAQSRLQRWMEDDIVLDEAPEVREVEVFELQHRNDDEWQAWVFSTSPYAPHSPLRVAGDRPRGTRFFEDVDPPRGWEWSNKKWTLDLYSREWVEERMISAVEVETEGERWVYDIAAEQSNTEDGLRAEKNTSAPKKDWEESSGLGPKGEWRRRRWVRLVKRKQVKEDKSHP